MLHGAKKGADAVRGADVSGSRDPYGKALDNLRDQIRDGVSAPGAQLIVVDIAKKLRISPTPVREALCELAGEGLVELERGRGFYVRRLEASDIADLYRLHRLFIVDGVAPRLRRSFMEADEASAFGGQLAGLKLHRAQIESLFFKLRLLGGSELERALRLVTDKLAVTRLVEAEVLDDIEGELNVLTGLWAQDQIVELSTAIDAYHVRRIDAARALAVAVRELFRRVA